MEDASLLEFAARFRELLEVVGEVVLLLCSVSDCLTDKKCASPLVFCSQHCIAKLSLSDRTQSSIYRCCLISHPIRLLVCSRLGPVHAWDARRVDDSLSSRWERLPGAEKRDVANGDVGPVYV
jgi:hypothetical protein